MLCFPLLCLKPLCREPHLVEAAVGEGWPWSILLLTSVPCTHLPRLHKRGASCPKITRVMKGEIFGRGWEQADLCVA